MRRLKKYTRREKERRLAGRQKHLCAFLFKLREKMEGKNQNIRIELGTKLWTSKERRIFRLKLDFGMKKDNLKRIIIIARKEGKGEMGRGQTQGSWRDLKSLLGSLHKGHN